MIMNASLASTITRAASKQSYLTIRYLVDRPRVEDAYRAYAYFRWVDDTLDAGDSSGLGEAGASERLAFLERQKSLLAQCLRGEAPQDASPQENLLVELVQNDQEKGSSLRAYLRNLMRVMDFDARRRGRLISQAELNQYTHWLAVAVSECMHHFIGHGSFAPRDEARPLAVSAAHIIHMLRDTYDDMQAGYFNIPREVVEGSQIRPQEVGSPAYCLWVKGRLELARRYFEAGKGYYRRVQCARHRLAAYAYMARFECCLETIEREGYLLRPQYNERKSFVSGLKMGLLTLSSLAGLKADGASPRHIASHR